MGNDATGRQRLMFRKGPVRHIDGGYRVDVDAAHRRILADLISQLRDEVMGNAGDDRFRRLFPVAYHEDPDHDGEYQRLMHGELLASRLDAITTALTTLGRDAQSDSIDINDAELDAMMRSFNDLRLVLGTLLDVHEDDHIEPPADDPAFAHFQLYGYLGWLLEWLVQAQQEARDDR
jgi:AcrR family transcriptional regulator